MSVLEEWLHESKPGSKVVGYLKSIRFKSLDVSLYTILYIFLKKLDEDDTLQRAQAVAFNFTLAVLPTIIFVFTLIPYLPIDNFDAMIFDFLDEMLPEYVTYAVNKVIVDIVSRPRGGLLSFGFFLAAFMATSGMRSLMDAFNSCTHSFEGRTIWKQYSIAFLLTAQLAFTMFSAIILLIYGKVILNALVEYGYVDTFFVYLLLHILRIIVITFMFFLNTALIYYLAPAIKVRWKLISPGSVIATTLGILTSSVFSYYLENFNTYNKLYGSIGAVIGVMFWILTVSYILLIGFQVNTTLDMTKERLSIFEEKQKKTEEGVV
ncbi:YihY/virulence factor BrkB family protein [Limibacter armeniacum]|uniref:YihY/virulence factor BrkB family protein n=1 Tax=Limibacter armeniacum TaxID=466084 RepID=UPI002FE574A4